MLSPPIPCVYNPFPTIPKFRCVKRRDKSKKCFGVVMYCLVGNVDSGPRSAGRVRGDTPHCHDTGFLYICIGIIFPIIEHRGANAELTRKEFEVAVAKMENRKAVGPEGIPTETIKYSPLVKQLPFEIVSKMRTEESLLEGFAQARFKMIFKNKGSSDYDLTKYRCIALLNHAYKILSHILLARMLKTSEARLQGWQAGFRSGRGCRDNTMVLMTVCKRVLQLGRALSTVYIDYSAAFDTVGHKFLDKALK